MLLRFVSAAVALTSFFSASAFAYNLKGAWYGSPDCLVQFWHDDGMSVRGNCYTGSVDAVYHEFQGQYIQQNMISGTITRKDPSGCREQQPFTITFMNQNTVNYFQKGWKACGLDLPDGTQSWKRQR